MTDAGPKRGGELRQHLVTVDPEYQAAMNERMAAACVQLFEMNKRLSVAVEAQAQTQKIK